VKWVWTWPGHHVITFPHCCIKSIEPFPVLVRSNDFRIPTSACRALCAPLGYSSLNTTHLPFQLRLRGPFTSPSLPFRSSFLSSLCSGEVHDTHFSGSLLLFPLFLVSSTCNESPFPPLASNRAALSRPNTNRVAWLELTLERSSPAIIFPEPSLPPWRPTRQPWSEFYLSPSYWYPCRYPGITWACSPPPHHFLQTW